ncbi:MAG: hypothetical protein B6U69_00390 [Thermofilum sp. ex4484_15]|nr:MAG: hypothetical protein B6U69_00390 [Thermofilum sp. ex4484_15]
MLTYLGGFKVDEGDLRQAIQDLKELYKRRVTEYSITGEPIIDPYPVIKVGRKVIRGYPLRRSKLRALIPYSHSKRVLAIDASAKLLFDCGPIKVVVSKVAWALWRGVKTLIVEEPIIRIKVVKSREEAAEWLLKLELSKALEKRHLLGRGDYLLLDRGLMAVPALRKGTKGLFKELDRTLDRRGAILVGISKVSRLKLSTGSSLVGYLSYMAKRALGDLAWYYYPLFREGQLPPWYIGDITVAKLSEYSKYVFRVDISRRALKRWNLEELLGEVAYLQDPATPGYPYPLKSVHELSKIGGDELELLRYFFIELAEDEGIGEQFRADSEAYEFKEEVLWGSLI